MNWPDKASLLHNVPAADYHADSFGEVPTASRSCLHTLLTVSPKHAAAEHPRIPGEKRRRTTKAMDTGSLVHALLLGGEESLAIVEAGDFRTKAAQEKRDAALAAGLVPICRPEYDHVRRITSRLQDEILAILADLVGETLGLAWRDLAKEVTCLWWEEDSRERVWNAQAGVEMVSGDLVRCRARLDLSLVSVGLLADLKIVTKGYAVAEPFIREMNSERSSHAMQAAMYLRGFEAVHPELAGRTQFVFLRVEIEPPYAVLAIPVGRGMRQLGDDRLNRALAMWSRCLGSGVWPGPRATVAEVEPWAFEREMQRRAEDEAEGGEHEA